VSTPWQVPLLWPGATVAVVGAGPSATPAAIAAVRGLPTIAVNRAITLVPDADMVASIDGNWPPEGDTFAGLRVVGVPCERDAYYLGVAYEVVRISPSEVLHIRNNTLWAMRIAARAGAKKIVLIGIDPVRYEEIHSFRGFAAGLAALVQEFAAQGIEVVHDSPEAKPHLLVVGMDGLGDSIHQRAVVRELARGAEVTLQTPWPQLYHDLGVRLVPAPDTAIRTAARNQAASGALYGEPPAADAARLVIGYSGQEVAQHGSIIEAMAARAGVAPGPFVLPVPAAKLVDLKLPKRRPVLVYKPLVARGEWGGYMSRDPDADAYRAVFEAIRGRFFVVSVADLVPGSEWLAGESVEADLSLHAGELGIEALAALFARATLVYSAPGFAPVLAQAVETPAITVFGGYEDARSFSYGARSVAWLPIQPATPCACWNHGHACDKSIDIPAAIAAAGKFLDGLGIA
jgi:hypothetical protein